MLLLLFHQWNCVFCCALSLSFSVFAGVKLEQHCLDALLWWGGWACKNNIHSSQDDWRCNRTVFIISLIFIRPLEAEGVRAWVWVNETQTFEQITTTDRSHSPFTIQDYLFQFNCVLKRPKKNNIRLLRWEISLNLATVTRAKEVLVVCMCVLSVWTPVTGREMLSSRCCFFMRRKPEIFSMSIIAISMISLSHRIRASAHNVFHQSHSCHRHRLIDFTFTRFTLHTPHGFCFFLLLGCYIICITCYFRLLTSTWPFIDWRFHLE